MTTYEKPNFKVQVKIDCDTSHNLYCKIGPISYPIENRNGVLTFGGDPTAAVVLYQGLNRMHKEMSDNEMETPKFKELAAEFKEMLVDNLKKACSSQESGRFEFEFEAKGYPYDNRTVFELLADQK